MIEVNNGQKKEKYVYGSYMFVFAGVCMFVSGAHTVIPVCVDVHIMDRCVREGRDRC